MKHKIAVVEQNPIRILVALNAHRAQALFLEVALHGICDGLYLATICTGADDEVVGEGADGANMEHFQIHGFTTVRGLNRYFPIFHLTRLNSPLA